MSSTPNPNPGESRVHRYISLLEHVGQVGADKIVPFADSIGTFVSQFAGAPAGLIIAKVIKAVGAAQANAYQAGDAPGTGPQKLSHVLASVSGDVAKTLDELGRPSDTAAVTQAVEQAVSTMKSFTIPVALPASPVAPGNAAVTTPPIPQASPATTGNPAVTTPPIPQAQPAQAVTTTPNPTPKT
jgi:hypothetical protein